MGDLIVDSFYGLRIREICKLPIFTVYNSPTDYPGKYVARLWDINKPTSYAMVKDTLEEIRKGIPYGPPFGFHRFLPSVKDDPIIVETWI